MIGIVSVSLLVALLFISIILLLVKRYTFMKRVFEYFAPNNFPVERQKQAYKEYKEALKQLDNTYTHYFNYMANDHKYIFKCRYLIRNKIAGNLYNDYKDELEYYDDTDIRDEAVERIEECIKKIYIIESGIQYFENHINLAIKTIDLLTTKKRNSSNFYTYYYPLVVKRITYLNNIIYQCENIIAYLKKKQNDIDNAIKELEKIKKPTLLGMVFNVVTAPIRHTFNIVDSILTGNEEKFIKSASMIGLTFLGAGVIGEAIDALDTVDVANIGDIDSLDTNIHFVEPHYVESYEREDGTVVSGYERGGESGYVRSNPDDIISNNIHS